MGKNDAPLIDDAKASIEREAHGDHELEHFDQFICKNLVTCADGTVPNGKSKIDDHTFKPVLFKLPTCEQNA